MTQQAAYTVTVNGKSHGLRDMANKLNDVAVAQDRVTKSSDTVTKAQGSAQSRLARLQRSIDPAFKSSEQLATAQRVLQRSLDQGAISQNRYAELLDLATVKYQANTGAAKANAMAVNAQAAATRASMHMSRQLSFQLIDIGQALATAPTMGIYALQNLGFQVAQIGQLYMGNGGFNQAIKDSVRQVGAFVTRMGPLAAVAAVVGGGFAALTHEINKTTGANVSMGNVIVATFNVVARSISSILQPAIAAISPYFVTAYNAVIGATKTVTNTVIGAFVGAYKFVIAEWSNLPAAFGDLAYRAANMFIVGIKSMIREAAIAVNGLIGQLNKMTGANVGKLDTANGFNLKGIHNPFAGAANANGGVDAFNQAYNTDYVGQAFGAIRNEAVKLATANDNVATSSAGAAKGIREAGKAAAETANNVGHLTDNFQPLEQNLSFARDTFRGFISDFRSGLQEGQSLFQSFANAIGNVALKIGDRLLDSIINPLFSLGGPLSNLFGFNLGGSAISSAIGANLVPAARPFAMGAAISNGSVVPMASGGVVSRPTHFPLAGGRTGLMGEAGTEGVFPLQRMRDGQLGVRAMGDGQAAPQPMQISITINGAAGDDHVRALSRESAVEVLRQYDRGNTQRVAAGYNEARRKTMIRR